MKISLNFPLTTEELEALTDHLFDLDLINRDNQLSGLAEHGAATATVPTKATEEIVEWLTKHKPRVIVWLNDRKVEDMF